MEFSATAISSDKIIDKGTETKTITSVLTKHVLKILPVANNLA